MAMNTYIDPDLHARFKAQVALDKRSITDVVADLIRAYLAEKATPAELSRQGQGIEAVERDEPRVTD